VSASEFAHPLAIERLSRGGVDESLTATADQRAALAARFDLLALDALSAQLRIERRRAEIRVVGRFAARGAQRCVATLDPAPFSIDAEIDERFTTEAENDAADGEELDIDALDAPELIEGETLDLGELVAQALSLALDPHPRAPHAPADASYAEPAPEVVSPFAKLATLKT